MNKKVYIYPASAAVPAIATALISILAFHVPVVEGILLGVLAVMVGIIIARLVVAILDKKIFDSFVASEVWGAIGAGLFGWFIFNTSEAIQTTLVFGMITCAINAFCFRFIAEKREVETVKVIAEAPKTMPEMTRKEKVAKLAGEMRYKLMDDGVTPNLDAPLCVDEDGHHLTPVEADEKGLGALYAEAIEYIKTIVK